jgi:hypothetical protein
MRIYKFIVVLFIFFQTSYLFLLKLPQPINAGNLYNASDTLSNSRLSYYGKVNGAHTAGTTSIAIKTSRTSYLPPDINTNHLFPLDNLSLGPNGYCDVSGTDKCKVSAVQNTSNFILVKGLRVGLSDGDPIYATQSAIHNIAFTTQTTVANGSVVVYIPAGGSDSATSQDGAPDGGPNAGFDLNGITSSNVSCPTGGGVAWGSPTITAYQLVGSNRYHKISCPYTGTLASTALTMTIGNSSKAPVNPAPKVNASYTHTQGTADSYNVLIQLLDGSSNIIDHVIVTTSPIESVLVSATVNPSLTLTIAGQNTGTICGQTLTVTGSTAYSVPFGDITQTNTFLNAAQKITVSTNATSGYYLKVAEDDEMSADLNGDGVPETTLADTTCDDGLCTHSTSDHWNSTTTTGFGYSLQNISAANVAFQYSDTSGNCSGGTYCARNFPCVDYLNPSNPTACSTNDGSSQTIASSSTVASDESIYVCYRLNIGVTQPAGYYQTRIYYVAYGTF